MKRMIRASLLVMTLTTIAAVSQDPVELPGFFPSSTPRQLEAEALIQGVPSPDRFGSHLRILTEEPHRTGTPRNMDLADYVRDHFIEYGLENVHFHDTPALLGYGRAASVKLLTPVEVELKLIEDPHPEDKDSYLYRDPTVVPYHEYALSGDVTADVVCANSGSPEDFEKLDELGVDVEGKIVVMRYSLPYSYRGYKVYMAESRGAVGTIIYSDPADDGYVKGETYPNGPWGPPSHVQWGSIVYDWFGFGVAPFTFHWEQQADGTWVEGPVRDDQLPKIPSIPMSHEDAAEILSRLKGPGVPEGWQGGLPFTYHVGPGPAKIRLMVDNVETVGTMRNVIGMIRGTEEPEKWVIFGNHRDAWQYGGVDPSSGTAAMLEVARALGQAVKKGFRPKRTLVFTNWDAEEDLLGGSTSWAQEHREKLRRDGVVYVNLDSAASGPDFDGGATPALADFLKDATRSVSHPDVAGSLYDAWSARFLSGIPEVESIVGATDYTAFQENVGMSCVDLISNGPYGVYHSQYDNYYWLSRFGDPGFRLNTMMSRFVAVLLWRFANVDVLPMRYSGYALEVAGLLDEIEKKTASQRELRLDLAKAAAKKWLEAAEDFERRVDERMESDGSLPEPATREVNDLLMQVERALTEETGLESRPFYKHLIYAPQPTYRKEILPRIFEAIEAGEWEKIEGFERELVTAFDHATELLEKATILLDS